MDARILRLINSFEKNGWYLEGAIDFKNDWWFEEIILLNSYWRPVGRELYLTLLTDPWYIKKKILDVVGVSSIIPENRYADFITQISLNEINKTNLVELVKEINDIVLSKIEIIK